MCELEMLEEDNYKNSTRVMQLLRAIGSVDVEREARESRRIDRAPFSGAPRNPPSATSDRVCPRLENCKQEMISGSGERKAGLFYI
jgi:hypothetical protein